MIKQPGECSFKGGYFITICTFAVHLIFMRMRMR